MAEQCTAREEAAPALSPTPWQRRLAARARPLAVPAALLVLLAAEHHRALRWLLGTWAGSSWGFAALLLVPLALRPMPQRRATPSQPHFVALALVALLDIALARLSLNIVAALLALVSLHLWALTFWRYEGRASARRQLWLALLCLPVVHWANVLAGVPVRQLAARVAAAAMQALGAVDVVVDGTLLRVGSTVLAVDTQCSGVKLLYCGLLFGLVAAPARARWPRRAAFWLLLLVALLAANAVRIVSLSMAHLQLGRPLGGLAHEAIGLFAFALACVALLLAARWLGANQQAPALHASDLRAPDPRGPDASEGQTPRRRARVIAIAAAAVVAACAIVRLASPWSSRAALLPPPALPATLFGHAARAAALHPSERLLARRAHVHLSRRSYGGTQVALLTVQQSVKELHPPQVCLEAAGFEIVSRKRRALAGVGCVQELRLRKGGQLSFYTYAYVSRGAVSCSFWSRTLDAMWSRLRGEHRVWSTVQVLDRRRARATAAVTALVAHLRRRRHHHHQTPRRAPRAAHTAALTQRRSR